MIWLIASRTYQISDLHNQIVETINLDISGFCSHNTKKMIFSQTLKHRKFLLILDNVQTPLDLLEELGIGKGYLRSIVLFSIPNKDLTLMEVYKTLELEPLYMEEGRGLFEKVHFQGSDVLEELECAQNIANKCEGFPLPIIVLAKSTIGKTIVESGIIMYL